MRPSPMAASERLRGGDDAHVHLPALEAADRAHLAVLKHTQELGLGFERQLSDLVEEAGCRRCAATKSPG